MSRPAHRPSSRASTRSGRAALAAALSIACVAALAAVPSPAGGASPSRHLSHGALVPTDRITVAKSESGRFARTDRTLLSERGRRLIPVVVKFDYDSLARYRGAIRGLAATSPSVTRSKLNVTTGAAQAYTRFVVRQEGIVLARIRAAVPAARVGTRLRTVYGGVAMQVPADGIAKLIATRGVVAVQRDAARKPLTDASPKFIGAPTVWTALHGQATAGKHIIFGSFDTGAWPEHPSYQNHGLPLPPPRADGHARICNFGDNPLTPANDPFVCNHKLISGQPFLATYNATHPPGEVFPNSARDSNGHGSHTSTTAAGDQVASAKIFNIERGPISGLAPGAHIAVYKVCGLEACVASDSVAAVGQALADGVDVINYSISGGTHPTTDPIELAFLDAYAAGVFVAASAGNSGPGAATSDHLGPWVTTVAASTQTRAFQSTLTLRGAGASPASLKLTGASITRGISTPTPVIKAENAPGYDAQCSTPAAPNTFTGKIVACKRGGASGRAEKGFNVKHGGAAGMILYNPEPLDTETDNHYLPAIHLEGPEGVRLLAFLAAHPGTKATFTPGRKAPGKGDVMAAFSSRGPGGTFLKPDITAPGVQILAANSPVPDVVGVGPAGQYYQAIAGTSMSSPHIAGSAILLKALHPRWTPGQIKSALMTTAKTAVVKEDQTTPADPFDDGAGRVDLNRAGDPGLTFDETAQRFALLTDDPVHAIDLNLPSVNSAVMPGVVTTSRVATNVAGRLLTYNVKGAVQGAGTSISVSPAHFTLPAGRSIRLHIKINAVTASPGQHFGQILLDQVGGPRDLHLPVAFDHQQSALTLTSQCSASTLVVGQRASCTIRSQNTGSGPAAVDLHTNVSGPRLRVTGVAGAARIDDHNVSLSAPVLAGKIPGRPSIAPGIPPGGGYLDLATRGVAPVAIGDDELLNYTLPKPFKYAGDNWTRIGLVSNGYAVVGGASSQDVQFAPQTLPDPAPPNNVLAPYWTDTTGDHAPGIYTGVVSDDTMTMSWFVAQWNVRLVGGGPLQTFQLWIGLNGTEDISFDYDRAHPVTDPGPLGLTIGAENFNGSGGAQITGLPPQDLLVTSVGGAPGAKLSYRLGILGLQPGPGRVATDLTSPAEQGKAVVESKVTIVPRHR